MSWLLQVQAETARSLDESRGGGGPSAYVHMLHGLLRLRQACNHPWLLRGGVPRAGGGGRAGGAGAQPGGREGGFGQPRLPVISRPRHPLYSFATAASALAHHTAPAAGPLACLPYPSTPPVCRALASIHLPTQHALPTPRRLPQRGGARGR